MDLLLNYLYDLRQKLISLRDQLLDKMIFTSLQDKELYELKGVIQGYSKTIDLIDAKLKEFNNLQDLPYNVRVLEEVNRKYNLGKFPLGNP